MTILSDLKRLNVSRTQGTWYDVGDSCGTSCVSTNDSKEHSHEPGYWICRGINDETNDPSLAPEQSTNFAFIAAAANAMEKLLDLVDAIKEMGSSAWDGRVTGAVKALEDGE